MSADPEQPIEKLLRTSAKQRRDLAGEPWEMHPVNRQLLQQEVARKFGPDQAPAHKSRAWLVRRWWFQAAGGLTALVILAGAVWLTMPRSGPREGPTLLARKEQEFRPSTPTTPVKTDQASAAALVPAERAKVARESLASSQAAPKDRGLTGPLDRSAGADSGAQRVASAANVRADAAAAQTPAGGAALLRNAVTLDSRQNPPFSQRYGLSGSAAPSVAAPPASATVPGQPPAASEFASAVSGPPRAFQPSAQIAGGPPASNEPVNRAQSYGYFSGTRVPAQQVRAFQRVSQPQGEALAAAPASVLSYFRIEQSGPVLRIIDSDNSVYAGEVQWAPAAANDGLGVPTPSAQTTRTLLAAKAQPQPTRPGYFFQVIGTNRTSNQRVVFSGRLSGLTNSAQAAGVEARSNQAAAGRVLQAEIAPAVRLSGTAQVGSAPQFELEAFPAQTQAPPR